MLARAGGSLALACAGRSALPRACGALGFASRVRGARLCLAPCEALGFASRRAGALGFRLARAGSLRSRASGSPGLACAEARGARRAGGPGKGKLEAGFRTRNRELSNVKTHASVSEPRTARGESRAQRVSFFAARMTDPHLCNKLRGWLAPGIGVRVARSTSIFLTRSEPNR
jgi:hypothetical protein